MQPYLVLGVSDSSSVLSVIEHWKIFELITLQLKYLDQNNLANAYVRYVVFFRTAHLQCLTYCDSAVCRKT